MPRPSTTTTRQRALIRRAFIQRALITTTGSVWAFAAACGGTAPPPEPGTTSGFPPDLRGRRVMLLPVQQTAGLRGDADAELAFALTGRAESVLWVLPAEVEEVLERSPGVQAATRGLPVGMFLAAEVERVGDPLYGQLRRMSALVDAEAVLLPVAASLEPQSDTTAAVRFTTAVIESRSGRVAWFGVVEGGAFPVGDPRGLASAAETLARTLLPYGRDRRERPGAR